MTLEDRATRLLAYATLQRTRSLLRTRAAWTMAVFLAVAYALLAMIIGQMLVLARNSGPHYAIVLWSSGNGTAPWNYPALLVSAGWGSLALPFFPTVAMVVMAVGVGVGMSVSVLLVVRLIRQPRSALGTPTLLGSAAGLTPAMIALVTLGACCSTTAAATAGLGIIAQASGTSVNQLLANNWYVGLFQIGILWVALVAQEQLIVVYSFLFGVDPAPPSTAPVPAGSTRPTILIGTLRIALVVFSVVWAFGMFAAWTMAGPLLASPGTWVHWLFQLELPAVVAGVAALFPREVAAAFSTWGARYGRWAFRGILLAAGISLLAWFPPVAVGWGVHGLGNELLGSAGLPASWGAVAPPDTSGYAIAVRWGGEYLLLGAFLVAFAVRPSRTMAVLAGSSDPLSKAGPAARPGVPMSPEPDLAPTPSTSLIPGRSSNGPVALVVPTTDGDR